MKSGGQNTTLADCVLSTIDVTINNNDVIFIKTLSVSHKLNSLQNVVFGFFYILRTNRMMLFCNLVLESPS